MFTYPPDVDPDRVRKLSSDLLGGVSIRVMKMLSQISLGGSQTQRQGCQRDRLSLAELLGYLAEQNRQNNKKSWKTAKKYQFSRLS